MRGEGGRNTMDLSLLSIIFITNRSRYIIYLLMTN